MCLWKSHNEPKIAQNDIEVWKVLAPNGLSPYYGYQYYPGKMNRPIGTETVPVTVEQQSINGGYLHAYTTREKADDLCRKLRLYERVQLLGDTSNPHGHFKLIEGMVQRMIIPKGSVYYEGVDDDICAECLYWPEEGTADHNPVMIKEV